MSNTRFHFCKMVFHWVQFLLSSLLTKSFYMDLRSALYGRVPKIVSQQHYPLCLYKKKIKLVHGTANSLPRTKSVNTHAHEKSPTLYNRLEVQPSTHWHIHTYTHFLLHKHTHIYMSASIGLAQIINESDNVIYLTRTQNRSTFLLALPSPPDETLVPRKMPSCMRLKPGNHSLLVHIRVSPYNALAVCNISHKVHSE